MNLGFNSMIIPFYHFEHENETSHKLFQISSMQLLLVSGIAGSINSDQLEMLDLLSDIDALNLSVPSIA